MFKKTLVALMLVLMMVSIAPAMEIDEVNLPETLEYGNKILVLNGGGTRNVFFNDVYVAGLWLENAKKDGTAVADAEETMAIRLHVISDFFASSKNITNALRNTARDVPKIPQRIVRGYIKMINSIGKKSRKSKKDTRILTL